eukprot:GHVU01054023.1.p1 GENE.GHVU01054023.1~~GHVU01054023.1.p1  ORF type:complete len:105 (-),score=0.36 GHVU01054023.1:30-344(-)
MRTHVAMRLTHSLTRSAVLVRVPHIHRQTQAAQRVMTTCRQQSSALKLPVYYCPCIYTSIYYYYIISYDMILLFVCRSYIVVHRAHTHTHTHTYGRTHAHTLTH